MSTLALSTWRLSADAAPAQKAPPKPDWPLMGDVVTVRAGVPETWVLWRRARGEAQPVPSDPDLRGRFNSNTS